MNIELNPASIQTAINDSVAKAVANALGSYDVTKAIGTTVTASVVDGAIADALRQAVASVDTGSLVSSLAAEIQKATTSAVVLMLREGIVTVVARMRGLSIDTYGEGPKNRAKLMAELFSGAAKE